MAKSAKKAGAQKGNQFGVKLKDPDVRQDAYNSYCAHLAKGKKKETWVFEHPTLTCTFKTMDRYIAEFPDEFPAIKKEVAYAKGYQVWEEIAEEHAKGQNACVTPALQMIMRNKFDWDKEEKAQDNTASQTVKVMLAEVKSLNPEE